MIEFKGIYRLSIGIAMIVNYRCIGTCLSGSIQEVKLREIFYSTSAKKYYIDKDDRMAHQVGHSKLKPLDYNGFFERKSIIDELEGSLTGAPIDATNPEVPAVAVDENSDKYITSRAKVSKINKDSDEMEIDLKEERKTEA